MTARTPRNRPEMPADAFEPPVAISSLAGSAFVSLSLLIAIVVMLWVFAAWLA